MLSRRVQPTLQPSPLYESFFRALRNAYHPTTNPNGIISLGIAENTLMYNDLAEFLNQNMKITPDLLGYGAVATGSPALLNGLLRLYNSDPFNPVLPVTLEHFAFTAGCTVLLDNLFWCFCDEGEGVLIGKPLYGGFANDLGTRARGTLIAVSLKGYDPFSKEAVKRYEEELLEAKERGVNARVLILCTPHNPLGQCYSREVMIEYMRLCQKYQIHLISDEIYALTTFPTDDIPNPEKFVSLLSIPKEGLIDPQLCHVLHGMSKDFCANGIRFGVLISQANKHLHIALHAIRLFSLPSSLAYQSLSTLLNHPTFLPQFLASNKRKLIHHYHICTRSLRANKIPYIPSNAGFFIWIDLTSLLPKMPGHNPLEKERAMNSRLLDGGIHLATSEAFFGEEYGWFRITFTVEEQTLELALKRLVNVFRGEEVDGLEMQNLNLGN